MEGYMDLKTLTFDELVGVVNLYPWFGNARKELCERLLSMGDSDTAAAAMAEASLYVPSRRKLAVLGRIRHRQDCSDKDIDILLKSYIAGNGAKDSVSGQPAGRRQVYAVGGDYFSQAEYDGIRKSEDNIFADLARQASSDSRKETGGQDDIPEFYTETLAQIYAEQGYPEQARKIYSQLILAYPEKNAYFAALIQKLGQEN